MYQRNLFLLWIPQKHSHCFNFGSELTSEDMARNIDKLGNTEQRH